MLKMFCVKAQSIKMFFFAMKRETVEGDTPLATNNTSYLVYESYNVISSTEENE